jgi:hypothetical protein
MKHWVPVTDLKAGDTVFITRLGERCLIESIIELPTGDYAITVKGLSTAHAFGVYTVDKTSSFQKVEP